MVKCDCVAVKDADSDVLAYEDTAVREALVRAKRMLFSHENDYGRSLMLRFHEALGLLPLDATSDEFANTLCSYARDEAFPREGDTHRYFLRVAATILDCLSAVDNASNNPYITWIRNNTEEIDRFGRARSHPISCVMMSEKGPSSCRMVVFETSGDAKLVCFDFDIAWIQDLVIEAAVTYSKTSPQAANISLGRLARDFAGSLGGKTPSNINGFGEEQLVRQLDYFEGDWRVVCLIEVLYQRIALRQQDGGQLASAGLLSCYLAAEGFLPAYRAGFRGVLLSPIDHPPKWDKLAVFPNGADNDFSDGRPGRWFRVDFTQIDEPLREGAKRWFWENEESLFARYIDLRIIVDFCAWRRKVVSAANFASIAFYLIYSEEVEGYLASLRKKQSPNSFIRTKRALRSFISFVADEDDKRIDPLCLQIIVNFGAGAGEGARKKTVMTSEHRAMVESAMKECSNESLEDLLSFTIFVLLAQTPLRISSVLNLKLFQVVETSRRGLYAIAQPSKTTGRDARAQQITPETKAIIDKAVQATQELRNAAPSDLRDYVFLTKGTKGAVKVFTKGRFNSRLWRVCAILELPRYNPSSIRSRYMTDADSAADELGMGWPARRAASGHVDPATDPRHYISRDDIEYYEALYGVEVGTAKVRGILVPEKPESLKDAEMVAKETGWCGRDSCAGAIATCMMCPSFRTSPSQIPAFKAALHAADLAIAELETDHDRQHMNAYKSLVATYLCALEGMARETEGGAKA